MTIETLPDVESAVRTFLVADADVTAARTIDSEVGSVGNQVTATTRYPMLRVNRVGGTAVDVYLDQPLLQVEAIGPPDDLTVATDDAVKALLLTAHAAIWSRLRWSTVDSVRFAGMTVVTHMQNGYDGGTKQLRYFSRISMAAHAVDEVS